MRFGSFVVAAFALVAPSALCAASPQNIVMIVVDDVGPELIGAYDTYFATTTGQPSGHPAYTPSIDAFAAEGLSFAHVWSNPLCSPTRATILTGRYCYRTGIGGITTSRPTTLRTGLSYDEVLLPEPLRSASTAYRSIALGKWHLAERSQLDANPAHPLGSPAGAWFDAWAGAYFQLAAPNGLDPAVYAYSVWKKAFANYPNSLEAPCAPGSPPCVVQMAAPPIQNYATVDTADDAIACLQEASGPLFLYVAFNAIHTPMHDVPSGLPEPSCPGYTPPPIACDYGSLSLDAARARCMLEALDKQVGRILCQIDFNTTTVILLGDNGTGKKNVVSPYPASHAKTSLYEGGVRAPLIIRSPVIPASLRGTFVSAPVNTVDLFATVCDLAGAPTPATARDSVSLAPYLSGSTTPLRDFVYAEEFFPHFTPDPLTGAAPSTFGAKHHQQAICDGRFKLMRTSRRSAGAPPIVTEKFFDLLEGAPPAAGSSAPTPDYFEQFDLLLSGGLSNEASMALATLRARLDNDFPYLTR